MQKDNLQASNEFFIKLYIEHSTWSRHQETQRSVVSNLIITISAILTGFMTLDKDMNINDLPAAVLMVLIGFFGMIFVYKFYIQFQFHDSRVELYKSYINSTLGNVDLLEIEKNSDTLVRNQYNFFGKYNLYKMWIVFHGAIATLGLSFLVLSLI